MARIFFGLASFAVALLVLNVALGFLGGDYNGAWRQLYDAARQRDQLERSSGGDAAQRDAAAQQVAALAEQFQPIRKWTTIHRLVGVAAALVTVLVNSITVTYFIGTARWCREVVETYHLDMQLAARSDQLKRRSFPWSAGGILIVIGLVTLGALSDPGANMQTSTQWVMPHYMLAIMGTAFIGYAFLRQVVNIGQNYEVIEQILEQVRQIRVDKGLESPSPNADAGDQSPGHHSDAGQSAADHAIEMGRRTEMDDELEQGTSN